MHFQPTFKASSKMIARTRNYSRRHDFLQIGKMTSLSLQISIDGMTCSSCSNTVERAVEALGGGGAGPGRCKVRLVVADKCMNISVYE